MPNLNAILLYGKLNERQVEHPWPGAGHPWPFRVVGYLGRGMKRVDGENVSLENGWFYRNYINYKLGAGLGGRQWDR